MRHVTERRYLRAVGDDADRAFARASFFSAAASALRAAPRGSIVLHTCIMPPVCETPEYRAFVAGAADLADAGVLVLEADLFNDDAIARAPHGDEHVLVNAWDSHSYIGNGGAGDPTIDGFMVAGTGPGRRLRNSSYLQNPFFSTALLEPEAWIRLPATDAGGD